MVLSLALPVPMVALLLLTRRSDVMGPFVSSRRIQAATIVGTVVVLALNTLLILQTVGVDVPGLPPG